MKSLTRISVLRWTFLTTAGWVIGVLLILLFTALLESRGMDNQIIMPICVGLSIGMMQSLALRKVIKNSMNWGWLLVIGLCIPFVLFEILARFIPLKSEGYIFILVPIAGIVSGYLQQRYILNDISTKAHYWVLVSFLAWFSFSVIGGVFFLHLPRNQQVIINVIALFSCGPVMGLITGYGIISVLSADKKPSLRSK